MVSQRAWETVGDLQPDTVYPYSIRRNGETLARGAVRTWPATAEELTFFVIGNFGNGSRQQYDIAQKMEQERSRLESAGILVRFVLSVGDNLYGKFSASGADDKDWEQKFFRPYAGTLAAIPFKAVLGNHDGDESEKQADLAACLDNLFMPGRWYQFSYGGFVELFALDSTRNSVNERQQPVFLPGGEQSRWLEETSAKPALPWRIAVMHHPMFTAGPQHKSVLERTQHWFETFQKSNFQMVLSGHEHNLQFSQRTEKTGGMQFVVSGAGGELRKAAVRKDMAANQIRAWANQGHFLVVRIVRDVAMIEPVGVRPIQLRGASGDPVPTPITVKLQETR